MRLIGLDPDLMLSELIDVDPAGVRRALSGAREAVDWCKREIAPYQAAALYLLAKPYDGKRVLEVGTALGYSAALLAHACPHSQVVTLNPKETEYRQAKGYLKGFPNVIPLLASSTDYYAAARERSFGLVFVDGSHLYRDVRDDCRWFDKLAEGGLILFHDYSPEDAERASAEAYRAIGEFGARLGRVPDVLLVDTGKVGMCGWVRRPGEEVAS